MSTKGTISYRPDIDGLRGLSVMAVVCFHLWEKVFPGGFIGVDVFFVLSGFLITSITLREQQSGTFSVVYFYQRRIKRIFPTLLAVLMAIVGMGWLICTPKEFASLGSALTYASVFLANFKCFHMADYFNDGGRSFFLLHLWSLGIEEQFYIFFPLLAYGWQKAKRWGAGLAFGLFVLIFMSSFVYCIKCCPENARYAFYWPLTRLWEIIAGVLLAFCVSCDWRRKQGLTGKQSNAVAVLGAIGLFSGFCFFYKTHDFPGSMALLPVVSTCCLLLSEKSIINRVFLSYSGLVKLGKLSYALYLWHWPWIVLTRLQSPDELSALGELGKGLLLLGISLLCTMVTTRCIETPLRGGGGHRILGPLMAGMAGLGLIGILMRGGVIYPFSHHMVFFASLEKAQKDWVYFDNNPATQKGIARLGHGKKIIVFRGDSNMWQYWPRVAWWMREHPTLAKKYTILFAYTSGLFPFYGAIGTQPYKTFYEHIEKQSIHPDVCAVVIASLWTKVFPSSASQVARLLRQGVIRLRTAGKIVFLMKNIPIYSGEDPGLVRKIGRVWELKDEEDGLLWLQRSAQLNKLFLEIAQETGAILIDPYPVLCPKNRCLLTMGGGERIYRDNRHLTATYVRQHAVFIDEIFQTLEAQEAGVPKEPP